MQAQRIGDLAADRPQRIQCDQRTLRDEADVPPAEALKLARGGIRNIGGIESQV